MLLFFTLQYKEVFFGRNEARVGGKYAEETNGGSLAVVGMAGRFPGASSADDFWQNLLDGQDTIGDVPVERWDQKNFYHPDVDHLGTSYSMCGGFLDDVDKFDAGFFNISNIEAKFIDPQQRLLLETSWHAMENAGVHPSSLLKDTVGIFVGLSSWEYFFRFQRIALNEISGYIPTGNSLSVAAGRIAYTFGFQGPAITVDTSCSSSLSALHAAKQSLLLGEVDVALVGSASLILSPRTAIAYSQAKMLSPSGRCRAFSAAADGFVRGEGCGVLVLKRLEAAIKDGDRIHACIMGSAVNQDGASFGLTVPNGRAQSRVIEAALSDARITAQDVAYIEAHGTGTKLGDPIELGALKKVFLETRAHPIHVGSVKSNIGHLEAAAGMAGLFKAIGAVKYGKIPASLHANELNPNVDWGAGALSVPQQTVDWDADYGRRVAGVSSFGFSGTNAHVIVGEAPEYGRGDVMLLVPSVPGREQGAGSQQLPHLLGFSAKSEPALKSLLQAYKVALGAIPNDPEFIADFCQAAARQRTQFSHRAWAVGSDMPALSNALDVASVKRSKDQGSGTGQAPRNRQNRLVFLCPGQGVAFRGMGQELYETSDIYRTRFDHYASIFKQTIGLDVPAELYNKSGPLLDTGVAQPALFCLQVALADYWRSRGVIPKDIVGHSLGEVIAAAIAGLIDPDAAAKFVARRANAMQTLCPAGSMISVFTSRSSVEDLMRGRAISLAAINGKAHFTLSGDVRAISDILDICEQRGISAVKLSVNRAFHSSLMDPALEEIEDAAASLSCGESAIGVSSNLLGRQLTTADIASGTYWVRQVREPVLFSGCIEALPDVASRTFLEIGPQPLLGGLVRDILPPTAEPNLFSSLSKQQKDLHALSLTMGQLFASGDIALTDIYKERGEGASHLPHLPLYPFEPKVHWVDDPELTESHLPVPKTASALPNIAYRVEQERLEPEKAADLKSLAVLSPPGTDAAALCAAYRHQGITVSQFYLDEQMRDIGTSPFLQQAADDVFDAFIVSLPAFGRRDIAQACSYMETDYGVFSTAWTHLADLFTLLQAHSYLLPVFGVAVVACVEEEADDTLSEQGFAPWAHGLWSAVRSARLETGLTEITFLGGTGSADTIANATNTLLGAHRVTDAWLTQDGLWQPKLVIAAQEQQKNLSMPDPEGAFVITGAMGSLGRFLLQWLMDAGCRHFILNGRDISSPQAITEIERLTANGAVVQCVEGSLADSTVCDTIKREAERSGRDIGLFHCAGVLQDGLLQDISTADLEAVSMPKIQGTLNLINSFETLPLAFFAGFSSIAALFGSPGQFSYAAANGVMDAILAHQTRSGENYISLNWGPWAGSSMLGGADSKVAQRFDALGFGGLTSTQALDAMAVVMNEQTAQAVIVEADWPRFVQSGADPHVMGMLTQICGADMLATPVHDVKKLSRLAHEVTGTRDQQGEKLGHYLRELIRQVAHLDEHDPLDGQRNLTEFGFDSLLVQQMKTRMERDLKLALPMNLFAEGLSIDELAAEITLRLSVARMKVQSHQPGEKIEVLRL
tara:strand:+ start:6210 stop:10838 length:4629 start_codon:yes stop_codon:yes gene_type:complete